MSAFPEPTGPATDRAEVLLRYVDYFRAKTIEKIESLDEEQRGTSTVPSGWTPLELLNHLTHVERRWLEWGFEGAEVGDPWADWREDRWFTDTSFETLRQRAVEQAARSEEIVRRHDLAERGAPGPRWDGAEPATLERVLLHLVQEYARHLGQLDVVVELAGGAQGE